MDQESFNRHLGALYYLTMKFDVKTQSAKDDLRFYFEAVLEPMVKAYAAVMPGTAADACQEGWFDHRSRLHKEFEQAAARHPQHKDILELYSCVLPELIAQFSAVSNDFTAGIFALCQNFTLTDACPSSSAFSSMGNPMSLDQFRNAMRQLETPETKFIRNKVFREQTSNTTNIKAQSHAHNPTQATGLSEDIVLRVKKVTFGPRKAI